MTGYDRKSLTISAEDEALITVEIDISGAGDWQVYQTFVVNGGREFQFPDAFQAYWVRFRSDRATTATAQLSYR